MTGIEEDAHIGGRRLLLEPFHSLIEILTCSLLVADGLHLHILVGIILLGAEHLGEVACILRGIFQFGQFRIVVIPHADGHGKESWQFSHLLFADQTDTGGFTVTVLVLCIDGDGTVAIGQIHLYGVRSPHSTVGWLLLSIHHYRNTCTGLQSLCQQLIAQLDHIRMERTLVFREQDSHLWRYRSSTNGRLRRRCRRLLSNDGLLYRFLHRGWSRLGCRWRCCGGHCRFHLFHFLHRNGCSMLTCCFVLPQLTHLLVLHHQYPFLITLSQGKLCILVPIVRSIGQVTQRLVVVDRHTPAVHIAIGQVILCLGKPLACSPFEPHGRRGIVLVYSLTVIEGIAQVELSFLTASLGCLLIAFHSLAELLLLVIVVALLEPLVGRLPEHGGYNHHSNYQYTESFHHFFGGLK